MATVAPITTSANPLETFERIVRLYIHAEHTNAGEGERNAKSPPGRHSVQGDQSL